jgi:hypothetical protein
MPKAPETPDEANECHATVLPKPVYTHPQSKLHSSEHYQLVLLWTQSAMPLMDRIMPIIVSTEECKSTTHYDWDLDDLRRLMTFFSTHHSPTTVKRKASVLTIGTVKLNSAQ